ncbi:MAG TPA: acyl-CoA thioesterase, partial [Opitutaceae bacterium]
MPSNHSRTVHFADTDAAGVVYFANYLSICHEAYEEALGSAGMALAAFFSKEGVVVPIAKCEAEYL